MMFFAFSLSFLRDLECESESGCTLETFHGCVSNLSPNTEPIFPSNNSVLYCNVDFYSAFFFFFYSCFIETSLPVVDLRSIYIPGNLFSLSIPHAHSPSLMQQQFTYVSFRFFLFTYKQGEEYPNLVADNRQVRGWLFNLYPHDQR